MRRAVNVIERRKDRRGEVASTILKYIMGKSEAQRKK